LSDACPPGGTGLGELSYVGQVSDNP